MHGALGTAAADQAVLQGMSASPALTVLQLCCEEASLEAEDMTQVDTYVRWKISPHRTFKEHVGCISWGITNPPC